MLALLLAAPIALGIAIFLSELVPALAAAPLAFLTELLAAIPAIVYGLWGIFVLVPVVRSLEQSLPGQSCAALPLFSGPPLGVGMLAAGLILAIMMIPFTSSVAREVLKAVPSCAARGRLRARRDALGGDPRGAVLRPHRHRRRDHPRLRPRARRDDGGDDGDRQQPADHRVAVRAAVHDGGVIANEFTEAADDLYLSALVEIGLVLFVITLIVNMRVAAPDLADEPAGPGARAARCQSARDGGRHGMSTTPSAAGSRRSWSSLCGLRCWSRWSRWPSSSSTSCAGHRR